MALLGVLAALPAAAQPVYQPARDAGASAAEAAGLASAMRRVDPEAKLTASDAAESDFFGYAVSLSGDRALVGAYGDDDAGFSSGAAYVFVRSGDAWVEEARLTAADASARDRFGGAVSLSGDRALIGADNDVDNGKDIGSAYVFVRSGSTWTQEAKLTAADAADGDIFGLAVSISGDRALVGAIQDDDRGEDSGSAYVFVRSGGTWTQEAKLTAADGAEYDEFGVAVSLSGDRALVGSALDDEGGEDSGAAYVFVRSGSTWTEEAKLTAADAAEVDLFGYAVSLAGDRALIGSIFDDDGGSASGSAYVFVRSGDTWTEEAKLTAADGSGGDLFGHSVALSDDVALVGAYRTRDPGFEGGSAYVFRRSGGAWTDDARITAADGAEDDRFGHSVSLSGDRALVGAPRDDDHGASSGSAYVVGLPPAVSTADDPARGVAITVYPNPTRTVATVSVEVAEAQAVRAEVFDALGRRVAVVRHGAVAPGAAVLLPVDVSTLAAGSYVVRIAGETFAESRRLTVVR